MQLKPVWGPIFCASATDPRFAVRTFLTAVVSEVTVPRRDGVPADFYTLFTINLQGQEAQLSLRDPRDALY